jgi:hypothetical protein
MSSLKQKKKTLQIDAKSSGVTKYCTLATRFQTPQKPINPCGRRRDYKMFN